MTVVAEPDIVDLQCDPFAHNTRGFVRGWQCLYGRPCPCFRSIDVVNGLLALAGHDTQWTGWKDDK